jgi:hypothetical protein
MLPDPEDQRKAKDRLDWSLGHLGGKWEGAGMISAIWKLLGALSSEVKVYRRDSPAPFQTMRTSDNLDAPTRSPQYLTDSARGL